MRGWIDERQVQVTKVDANLGEELGQRAALASRVMKECQCPLQDHIEIQGVSLCGDTVLQM